MKNNIEIEAKIKVDNFDNVQILLKDSAACFIEQQIHFDYYYRCTENQPQWIRIRVQIVEGKGTIFLTFKGAKEKSIFKKRIELEIELKISEFQSLSKILIALGYERDLILEKTRRLWKLNSCDVCLDDVISSSLGCFIEIEGPNEYLITAVQNRLGLEYEPIIKEGYHTLLSHKDKAGEQDG